MLSITFYFLFLLLKIKIFKSPKLLTLKNVKRIIKMMDRSADKSWL